MACNTLWKRYRHAKSFSSRAPAGRSYRRRPPLRLEFLEARTLLAGDVSPTVGFRLGLADPISLEPIEAARVGEEFALVAYVRDLRETPQGVFSAYLDINFPAAQFEVSGPIRHVGGFMNGTAGAIASGLIDEVGGFVSDTRPPGGAEQRVAAVSFIPRQEGEFTFTADNADLLIGHEVLVFGQNGAVALDALQFQELSVEVLPASGTVEELAAIDDEFFLGAATSATLDVLANDSSPVPSSMTIFAVNAAQTAGEVAISSDNRRIEYQPPAGFSGVDQFSYSVVDGNSGSDTATVLVHVEGGEVTDKKATFRVITTDRTGRPVATINEGDEFLVKVVVGDTRANPQGVFAAYVDLAFPPQLAQTTGPIEYTGTFNNGVSGSLATPGLIDEAGAFTSRLTPPGTGEYVLFQIPMKALSSGSALFQSGPADLMPDHQSLLFGENLPLLPNQIAYGETRLEIRSAVLAVDDSFDLSSLGGPVQLNVLGNDRASTTSPLTITKVDTAGLRGTVSVASDGSSLTFAPAVDSRGTESFRYTAANASGSATAEVTIHLQPAAPLDDVMEIRLQTVDLEGNPISSVAAGGKFGVQAWVRDLRGPGEDRGVYAAYFDLLYDAAKASAFSSPGGARAIDVEFGPQFGNGRSGSGSLPGIVDEIGAFQSDNTPAGSGEQLLFTATFQANSGQAGADTVTVAEDSVIEIDVLANDLPNQGTIRFRSDPADRSPQSDVLMFDPVAPVEPSAIRFLSAELEVQGGAIQVASVTPSQRGGSVTIAEDGRTVRYEPPANYFGSDQFTYSLGSGVASVVLVNVTPVNDAPTAESDSYVATHQKPLTVLPTQGVLANDSDVDRDTLQARLVTTTAHGQLTLAQDGSFTYVPNAGFFGDDKFVYRAFDGKLESASTEVHIEVAPPAVQIRLEATDSLGEPLSTVPAGESFVLHAFVKDRRDSSRNDRGVGAVYMDLTFDPTAVQPQPDTANPLGFAVTFGPQYQNVATGSIATPGLVNDVGALQTSFSPIGGEEVEVFSLTFKTSGPFAVGESVRASSNSTVNVFNVLENERNEGIEVAIVSQGSGNSPYADIVLFEPAQAVGGADVSFGSASILVKNSEQLVVHEVSQSEAGGTVSIDPLGRGIRYTPPQSFVGMDSFTYTIKDEFGRTNTAQVEVEVVQSWTNESETRDVNGDSFVSTNDALQVINNLNNFGSRKLEEERTEGAFLDVNQDGFVTPIDALVLINFLARQLHGEGEGSSTSEPSSTDLAGQSIDSLSVLIGAIPSQAGAGSASSSSEPATGSELAESIFDADLILAVDVANEESSDSSQPDEEEAFEMGTDAVEEWLDVSLCDDDLQELAKAIVLSK